jgi:NOL1/NOP2/fmu family ribosome biogenesis protein/precorrin-6B methylase 2
MCAAPGGKTTLYSAIVGDRGLVLANEYVRNRANILADNVRKWGLGNVVVTNNDPQHIAAFEQWADVVAVDAPCSGEGMFRKDEVARSEWTAQSVDMCAARQMDILRQAWKSLKAGGLLIYSTCTFNRDEDEKLVQRMCQEWGDELESVDDIALPEEWGVVADRVGVFQTFRFFPHRVKGEGMFMAVARRSGIPSSRRRAPKARREVIGPVDKRSAQELSRWVKNPEQMRYFMAGDTIYACREEHFDEIKALSSRLAVIYSGVAMGQIFKNKLKPDGALAFYVGLNRDAVAASELSLEEALQFLRKQDMSAAPFAEGVNIVLYDGLPLGFVKRVGARVNNMYPSSLRILK